MPGPFGRCVAGFGRAFAAAGGAAGLLRFALAAGDAHAAPAVFHKGVDALHQRVDLPLL